LRWAGHVRGAYRVLVGNPEEEDHLKDPGIDGRILLKWIFEKWVGKGVDWIDVAEDRDRWRALVNVVINLWVL
jgi:hypothetical protein